MSECNNAGIFIFFEPLSNGIGKIVLVKNNKRIVGNGEYKSDFKKLKKGDLRYDKIIFDLYHTEFLKLGLGERADESFPNIEIEFALAEY